MKTFKQYIKEDVNESFKQEFLEFFSAEPFRFTPIDDSGIQLRRKLLYPKDNEVSNMYITRSHEYPNISISYPIAIPNVKSAPDIKTYIRNEFNSTEDALSIFTNSNGNIDLSLRFGIYDTVRDCRYGIAKTFTKEVNNYIRTQIEMYNIYEDTPGTDVDKVLALIKFVGMTRSEILKFKYRFGLLTKDDELSDKDTLDLF